MPLGHLAAFNSNRFTLHQPSNVLLDLIYSVPSFWLLNCNLQQFYKFKCSRCGPVSAEGDQIPNSCTEDLIQHTAEIFDAFLDHPKSSKSAFSWAHDIMKRKYANDIRELSHKDNGWHFGALKTLEQQLTDFWIDLNSKGIQNVKVFLAPVAAMEMASTTWICQRQGQCLNILKAFSLISRRDGMRVLD